MTGSSSDSVSQRMIGFIVSPWITRVPNTTANAHRRMRSRNGNGDPSGSVSGTAKAAARVTMPRMPAQETTMPPPHDRVGRFVGAFFLSRRNTNAV